MSKLTLFKEFEDAKANYEDAVKSLQTLEEQRHQLHANLKVALETKNKFEAKEFGNQRSLDKASGDLKVNNCQLKYVEQNLQQLSDQLNLKKYNLADYEAQIEAYERELSHDFSQEMKENQTKSIKEMQQLKNELTKTFQNKMKVEEKRNSLKNEIEEIVSPKIVELQSIIASRSPEESSSRQATLSQSDEEKSTLQQTIGKIKEAIKTTDDEIARFYEKENDLKVASEELAIEIEEIQKEHLDISTKATKALVEEQNLEGRLIACDKGMNQYGLPEGIEKYKNLTRDECLRKLEAVNKKLVKFDKVNKKAIDIYEMLKTEKKNMEDRFNKCKYGVDQTQDICQMLDERKLKKVDFTFKQVAKYFEEIFQILVPNGRGKLIFTKTNNLEFTRSPNDSLSLSEQDRPVSIDIKVSFNGGAEVTQLSLLSGGQKTAVALAYTFALQKCDPSPIYIFDEIDANLDSQTREKVAEWLTNLKNDSTSDDKKAPQFITTSFRRELVEVADKVIHVSMSNSASKTMTVTKEQAMQFIQDTTAA